VNEDDIRDFLVEHPDYLQKNPELLSLLQVPHASGAAVSLVERQVSVLRERNVDLRHRLRDLGAIAKDNDQLFADTRTMVLALLAADDLTSLEHALLDVMHNNFDLEYASLTLFDEAFPGDEHCRKVPESEARNRLAAMLGSKDAGCGVLRADEFEFLFPGVKVVGSVALALINDGSKSLGLLAVGSSNAGQYDSNMGTLFLEFGAEVLARLLPRLYRS
jgi:uncharacterized protein YigA (DUF484 family)